MNHLKEERKRDDIIYLMIYLCKNITSNNNFMKRRKNQPTNKETNERKREIKLPPNKESI